MLGPHGADMSLVGNISQLGDTISVFVSQSALFEPDGGQQSQRMQDRLHRKAGIHGEASSVDSYELQSNRPPLARATSLFGGRLGLSRPAAVSAATSIPSHALSACRAASILLICCTDANVAKHHDIDWKHRATAYARRRPDARLTSAGWGSGSGLDSDL